MSATVREGQTYGGTSRVVRYVNFVKLAHTVFALPFALVGVVLASRVAPVTVPLVGWVVLAFTAARFAAMGFNRIADRQWDARNPRTAMRELPSGVMTVTEASVSVAVASAVFVFAAWRINPLCFALSPVALGWVLFYSYTKRFTRWAHLVLGLGLGIAPAGGYLAVTGAWSDPWWLLPALAMAVMSWVGGFDILYALPDAAFDRAQGLFSIPATMGAANALRVSRALHVVTVLTLGAAGVASRAGVLFFTGVAVAGGILAWEHSLVTAEDQSRLDAAFFSVNGILSVTFFLFVLAERVFL
ncbi:MAG: putative 4-hydroxybenzoate polyprenyltransferase [Gemmatimonadota bacterium]|nr:putative 4-hydroxybenzoate polyprenyltransferase [Gemmatimonadota bacterium]